MQLPRCEAGGMAEQANHGMALPLCILEPLAEYHVTAALAVHWTGCAELSQPLMETMRLRKHARVQLRIAARQPAGVAIVWRRLIGQRRKTGDLSAGPPPSIAHMRIHEREGRIRCNGDALPGWGQGGTAARWDRRKQGRHRHDAVEIKMALRHAGKAVKLGREIAMFLRLHQPEMPFRYGQCPIARDRAEYGDARCFDRVGGKSAMALAADPI